jgi:hypothetical protein
LIIFEWFENWKKWVWTGKPSHNSELKIGVLYFKIENEKKNWNGCPQFSRNLNPKLLNVVYCLFSEGLQTTNWRESNQVSLNRSNQFKKKDLKTTKKKNRNNRILPDFLFQKLISNEWQSGPWIPTTFSAMRIWISYTCQMPGDEIRPWVHLEETWPRNLNDIFLVIVRFFGGWWQFVFPK